MTAFQILMIILSALGLLTGIVSVHIKSQVEIAKIQVQIKHLQQDSDQKEISICNLEQRNHEEHNQILNKIDDLLNKYH